MISLARTQRWYYHADRLGVLIFQDMVQKYGGANNETIPYFVEDFKKMVAGRGNHPSIVQFETFNEGDCWGVFKTKPFDVPSPLQNYLVCIVMSGAFSKNWDLP